MNILEIEDMVKGLPDQALQKEAQQPTGANPTVLSRIRDTAAW